MATSRLLYNKKKLMFYTHTHTHTHAQQEGAFWMGVFGRREVFFVFVFVVVVFGICKQAYA